MKKTFFGLLMCTALLQGFGQTPDWQWANHSSMGFNGMIRSHDIDSDGNIIMAGDYTTLSVSVGGQAIFNTQTDGSSDIYIAKYSDLGNVIWARNIGGVLNNTAGAVVCDHAGNFYFAGSFTNQLDLDGQQLYASGSASFVAKFAGDGQLIWMRTSESQPQGWSVSSLAVDQGNNLYMAGSYNMDVLAFGNQQLVYENHVAASAARIFFGKIDSDGACLWLRGPQASTGNGWGSTAFDISVDHSGNVNVTGKFCEQTLNFGGIAVTKSANYDYTANYFLAHYDAAGEAIWVKSGGSAYSNLTFGYGVANDHDDNVIMTGFITNDVNFDDAMLEAMGGSKHFIAKYTENGDLQWARSVSAETCAAISYSVDVDADGHLYVAGFTSCPSLGFGEGVTTAMSGEGGLYVACYDADGTALWVRRSGSTNVNNVACIRVKTTNEMYVSGTFFSPTLTLGPFTLVKSPSTYDYFLAKLYAQPLGTGSFEKPGAAVAPNPSEGFVHVRDVPAGASFEIVGLTGKSVLTGTLVDGTADIRSLANGVYFLKVSGTFGFSLTRLVKTAP